eukprot:m.81503 g.81503  ORF g.81503 m.81503 type:complete len:331 (+) comp14573_c1_seq4:1304-2296(+)
MNYFSALLLSEFSFFANIIMMSASTLSLMKTVTMAQLMVDASCYKTRLHLLPNASTPTPSATPYITTKHFKPDLRRKWSSLLREETFHVGPVRTTAQIPFKRNKKTTISHLAKHVCPAGRQKGIEIVHELLSIVVPFDPLAAAAQDDVAIEIALKTMLEMLERLHLQSILCSPDNLESVFCTIASRLTVPSAQLSPSHATMNLVLRIALISYGWMVDLAHRDDKGRVCPSWAHLCPLTCAGVDQLEEECRVTLPLTVYKAVIVPRTTAWRSQQDELDMEELLKLPRNLDEDIDVLVEQLKQVDVPPEWAQQLEQLDDLPELWHLNRADFV